MSLLWFPVDERDDEVQLYLLDRHESFAGMFCGPEMPDHRIHGRATKHIDDLQSKIVDQNKYPDLLIHHMAYSGSTLMSHLLDQPDQCIVFSEPKGCSFDDFDFYVKYYANMSQDDPKSVVKLIPTNTLSPWDFYSRCNHVLIYTELQDFLTTTLCDTQRIRLIKRYCIMHGISDITHDTTDAVYILCKYWLAMVEQYYKFITEYDSVLLVYSSSLLRDPEGCRIRVSNFANLGLDPDYDLTNKIGKHSKFQSDVKWSTVAMQKLDRSAMCHSQLQHNRLVIHDTLQQADPLVYDLFRHPLRVV